jgi:hypothetical protein
MVIVNKEYVLACKKIAQSRLEMPAYWYLEERYAAEQTLDLQKAFRTRSLEVARQRLADLHASGNGYAKGFKVMTITQRVSRIT